MDDQNFHIKLIDFDTLAENSLDKIINEILQNYNIEMTDARQSNNYGKMAELISKLITDVLNLQTSYNLFWRKITEKSSTIDNKNDKDNKPGIITLSDIEVRKDGQFFVNEKLICLLTETSPNDICQLLDKFLTENANAKFNSQTLRTCSYYYIRIWY